MCVETRFGASKRCRWARRGTEPAAPVAKPFVLPSGQILMAPLANGADDGDKASTRRGEAILDLGRNRAKVLANNEPGADQRLQFPAKHARRYGLGSGLAAQKSGTNLAIAQRTVLEIPDDAQLVLAANHLLKGHHRTAAGNLAFSDSGAWLRHGCVSRCLSEKVYTILFVHTCKNACLGPILDNGQRATRRRPIHREERTMPICTIKAPPGISQAAKVKMLEKINQAIDEGYSHIGVTIVTLE